MKVLVAAPLTPGPSPRERGEGSGLSGAVQP